MRPMLAKTVGPKFSKYPCFIQPKLNGVRALYQNGVFQSRDEKLWGTPVLSHLVTELHSLSAVIGNLILDGELYVHGWKLGRINGAIAVNRKGKNEDTESVEYHIFDVVDPVKPQENFSERFLTLKESLLEEETHKVKLVETLLVHDLFRTDNAFNYFVSQGYEGIMLRPDGPYEPDKRSQYLWKRKQWEDDEFLCVGWTRGEGKADIGVGSLECEVYHTNSTLTNPIRFTFSVGTGFDDSERIALALDPPIGKLVRVRYPYLSADGIPQCPSFIAVL